MLLAVTALTATVVPVGAAVFPISGNVGDSVTINQSGVTSDATYQVGFYLGGTLRGIGGNVTATGTEINANAVVPQLPKDTYQIRLTNISNSADTFDTGSYTIIPEIYYMTPTTAAVGSTVAISGTGFATSSSITIYVDGDAVESQTQTSTSANGSFSAQFVVPSLPQDDYPVIARDSSLNTNPVARSLTIIPGITLSEDEGFVGDTITVEGGGFTEDEEVEIYYGSVDDDFLLATVDADDDGEIEVDIVIPAAQRGNLNIIAYDVDTETSAPPVAFDIQSKITLSPTTGSPGSTVTITGTGFNDDVEVTFEWDGDDEPLSSFEASTDDYGSFEEDIVVPNNVVSGEYTITALDSTGSADADFNIAASIVINPSEGSAGTQVTVTGKGFDQSGTVTVYYNNQQQTTATLANGAFTATFTVPGGLAQAYEVKAIDDDSNIATTTFTATLSATLSPTTTTTTPGHVGQELTVTGTGFLPNAAITVAFGNSNIGSGTSSDTGAFTINFDAPAVAAGNHNITVTDGTNTRNFTFVMEDEAPAAPVLTAPTIAEKPDQPITFEWEDVTDDSGVTYRLEVATDSTFNTFILTKEDLTTSSYTATEEEKLPSVSSDEPYFWRVIATDGAGNQGEPAEANTFVVGFSFDDLIPDDIPMWAWIVIGVLAVAIIGGVIYYFWQRAYTY